MKVFNLTERYIDYRRKVLPPYGSQDYDMDFIPDRDLGLQKAGVLAFGSLPPGWSRPVVVQAPEAVVNTAPPVPVKVVPVSVPSPGTGSKVEFAEKAEEKKSKK